MRDNIASSGGDPVAVTPIGQSADASSIDRHGRQPPGAGDITDLPVSYPTGRTLVSSTAERGMQRHDRRHNSSVVWGSVGSTPRPNSSHPDPRVAG
ncbi:hypothetical protein [Nocardia spumae]|uniref:hypothetical protein n=1 Tax=Nocardia spumae TaxID=2887190 RepID=UPI0027E15E25|nr:hypothetical protein [Nocardia spumae]